MTGRKPSLIGSVNGMIVGLVAITPGAGFVNGWGAIVIGVIAATIVYFALNYLSRAAPFRNVDDTLGVVYTHGFAGLAGGLLVGIFANTSMAETVLAGTISGGGLHLLGWQALTALWVIVFSAIGTFILLKLVGLFVPLRMTEEEMENGDIAVHGHEVYPSDVPSLGYPAGVPRGAPEELLLARRSNDPARSPPPGATTKSRSRSSPGGGSSSSRAECRASSPPPGWRRRCAGSPRTPSHRAARAQLPDRDVLARRGERELGDQRDTDPRRDEALDRLVVVAFEGDARLEAGGVAGADDVPGAGAGGRGLNPGLLAEVRQARLEPAPGKRVVGGKGQVEGVVEQREAPHARRQPLAGALELEEQREVELARPQTRPDLLRLPLGEGHLDTGVRGAEAGDRLGISVAPAVGKDAVRSRPPRPAAMAAISSSADSIRARIPPTCGTRAAPAAVGRAPPRLRSISGAPASSSSVAIACETADCE